MSALAKLYFGWTTYLKVPWTPLQSLRSPPSEMQAALQGDGISLLAFNYSAKRLQCVLKTNDQINPQLIAQRLKGRWNYALRGFESGFPGFERSFVLRSLGQNTKDVVRHYIESQVDKSDLVDPLYREKMNKLRFQNDDDGLIKKSHKAAYDLFLHVIFVAADRYRMFSPEAKIVFEALKSGMLELGADPYEGSMMPDHAHFLVRWPTQYGAADLLEAMKQASGRILRRSAFWSGGGYIGTVGPYSLRMALERNGSNGWVA